MNVPQSVIWFGISAVIAIGYGLHVGHINSVGFEKYIDELIKKHDLDRRSAQNHARFNFLFSWIVFVAFGITATVCAAISFLNAVNPK